MGACLAKEKAIEQPRSDENLDRQKSTTKIDTLADLNAKISTAESLVVIDFFAVWCPPCKNIAPRFDAMSKEHKSCQDPPDVFSKHLHRGFKSSRKIMIFKPVF